MGEQTVLICGAGIAGPTLAYWLAQSGWRPTLVEHAVAPRSSGAPVDVRGRAVEVAERMGVMPRIRQAATDMTGISFVDATGRRVGGVNLRALQQAAGSREVDDPRKQPHRTAVDRCLGTPMNRPTGGPEGRGPCARQL